jgi:hypothetical protein
MNKNKNITFKGESFIDKISRRKLPKTIKVFLKATPAETNWLILGTK